MKYLAFFILIFAFFACNSNQNPKELKSASQKNTRLELNENQALRLSKLPLKCIQNEYPNKLGQVLNDASELKPPKTLHPAFYGCFDWHSSVHGHWLLVRLLKKFPSLENGSLIRETLNTQLTKENIEIELAFFKTKNNQSFERTYGWAWLLKLQEELNTWNDGEAKKWAKNLQPLTDFIVEKYTAHLPKLLYPIRTGEHVNTAFGLSFAFDYAKQTKNYKLTKLITERAKYYFLQDKNYPLQFEPSGTDFLSPAFEEVDLMRRVLSKVEFLNWLDKFLPTLKDLKFKLAVGKVSDRTDGKLVHLDGLNFSRAWCLYGLASNFKEYSHLQNVADKHLDYSLPSIVDGDYMGEHWLASFALYSLLERK
ncbi:MAG: hypothetical protein RI883_1700 [Bacteroidota bacterium]|jgi:hypothetical protein